MRTPKAAPNSHSLLGLPGEDYSWWDVAGVQPVLLAETVNHYHDKWQEMDEGADITMRVAEVAQSMGHCLSFLLTAAGGRRPAVPMRRGIPGHTLEV